MEIEIKEESGPVSDGADKKEGKIKTFFKKIWGFIRRHKWSMAFIVIALAIGGFFLWDSFSAGSFNPIGDLNLRPKKVEKFQAPLSGRWVTEKERTTRKPMAVVIENHPDARPQSGLNKAALVYETFAEGGITRWLALFQEEDVSEIGPVRSARTYFVDWALSHVALFAHVGGNIDALDMISKYKVLDLNQFSLGNYFWRDEKRYAPHNVYTTTDKLREAARSKGYSIEDSNISGYSFKDEAKEEERPEPFSFVVNFNSNFAVTWAYDKKSNQFSRSMASQKQTDRVTGEQLVAKNVIVMFSSFSYGTTRIGEQKTNIVTTGSGEAIFYIDGKKQTGTWKRAGQNTPTRFYDSAGAEIKLNSGTTWIEVAPTGTAVN